MTCHDTALQEEECEENFVKKCFIEYSKTAANVTAKVCRTPLVKVGHSITCHVSRVTRVGQDCEVAGEEICSTQYESECWTKAEVHEVEDDVVECRTEVEEKCEDETSGYTTNTKCSKWPR